MSTIQFIEHGGKRAYAVIPYPLYQRLAAMIEDAEDIQALEAFYADDDGFRIPGSLLRRELAGESPVMLWREHRGVTLEQLADITNIDQVVLAQIERGILPVPDESMTKLAQALDVPEDILVD